MRVALAALVAILLSAGLWFRLGVVTTPPAPTPAPAASAAPAVATAPVGWIDAPTGETIVGTEVHITGWALDRSGIDRVEVRIGGKAQRARYGIPRPDVAQARPGYPDSSAAGFEFAEPLDTSVLQRQPVEVVAINRAGVATTLGMRSAIAPEALSLWRAQTPSRASNDDSFAFLMMTSGVAAGGAAETDTEYRAYVSGTQRVGISVPILYLRTTKGAANDWAFDPTFDLGHKCRDRPVAEDNLRNVITWAVEKRVPVQFNLNGGIWGDATCDTPEWDVNDALERDPANCQWNQDNQVLADDFLKHLPGSTESPELGRSLTYHVYATQVRAYKRRNLQAAAAIIAAFAREHPDLFVGVNLDADTYMNPFVRRGHWFDYNPGMLRQFREWLSGTGAYGGKPQPGVPDLSRYRRTPSLTLAQVNRMARRNWSRWSEVDPPRRLPEDPRSVPSGETPFWEEPWFLEWDAFRKHVVALHYSELSEWVHATGIPEAKIFSAQGFMTPDPGLKPIAIRIRGDSPNYDSAGVSIEGAIPSAGHLGAILYGPAAANDNPLANGHSLFATIARMDPGWAVVEMNPTDLKKPTEMPGYAVSYRAFRDLFNFDARQVSLMAWNGANGLFAGQPGYVPYTSWRNTAGEAAMRDFLVAHADLPLGSRLWTFGAPGHADDDGWSLDCGPLAASGGHVDAHCPGNRLVLRSPPDQVIRTDRSAHLVLGLAAPAEVASVQVLARTSPESSWVDVSGVVSAGKLARSAAGWNVPVTWPARWQAQRAIVQELGIVVTVAAATADARIDRIAIVYPAPARAATSRQQRASGTGSIAAR